MSDDVEKLVRSIEGDIKGRLHTARASKRRNQRLFMGFAIVTAVSGALSTLFVALSQFGEHPGPFFGYAALVVTATLTALNSVEAVFKPRDRLLINGEAINALKQLRNEITWQKLTGESITRDHVQKYRDEYEKIQDRLFKGITNIHADDSDQSDAD